MMRAKILILGLACLHFTSCATLFKGTSEEVRFSSDPQRADVYVNGNLMGTTPVSLKLEVKKTYVIEFRKEGYKSKTYNITNHVGAGWVILDVLAGLVGVIIDAATGAWYSLDQKNVDAILEKQQPLEKPQMIRKEERKVVEKPKIVKEEKVKPVEKPIIDKEKVPIEKPQEIQEDFPKKLEVIIDRSEIRLMPDKKSQVIGKVRFETILQSTGKTGDWYRVDLPSSVEGVTISGFIHKYCVREVTKKK